MLHDRAMSSHTAQPLVLNPDRHHHTALTDAEREYVEHRSAVRSALRTNFPQLADDWEALYHDAWIEMLELRARGNTTVLSPRAMLKTIAQRRAVDLLRRRAADPIDPEAPEFLRLRDDAAVDVDEAAVTRVTADVLHQIIETLEPRQRIVLKMRFDLRMGASEIQARMGVSEKRLEKIFAETYRVISEQLEVGEGGVSRWTRRQRSLLLACELGIATPAQRERAQQLLNRDPQCRLMLQAMRSTMRDVAVVLPMPPAAYELDDGRRPFSAVLDWLGQATVGRHPSAEVVAARATGSTISEQAGGTLLGGLGLGGAVKVAAACLALGGAAAVCVTDVRRTDERPRTTTRQKVRKPAAKPRPAASVTVPVVRSSAPQPVTGKQIRPSPAQVAARARERAAARQVPSSSPAATAPVSPAPAGATEFGPGASGSDPVAPAPAAAPQDGGGEFGP